MIKEPKNLNNIESFFIPHKENQLTPIMHLNYERDDWLKLFYRIVEKKRIKLILLYGTCLGIVRDKRIIEGDTDADYGIYLEDLNSLYLCIDELCKAGFYISGRGKFQITFKMPNTNFYIDIWPIQKIKNPLLRCLGIKWLCDHVYYKHDFFHKPKSTQFNNLTYYLPSSVEMYLETVFGPDWRIPIKGKFSGPRGLLSQWLNKYFVDFPIPLPFSGDNNLGTYKPWVSKLLITFFPNSNITSLFKHPKKIAQKNSPKK